MASFQDSDSDAESDKELGEETTNYETKNLPLLEEGDPVFLAKRGFKEELDKDEEQSSEDEEKREELKKTAQVWLEKLDPFSPEGLWFERFAEKYESKLAAAIDYLLENSG